MEKRRNVKNSTDEELTAYEQYLREKERNRVTVEKYPRDARKFQDYICERGSGGLDKELVLKYKQYLNRNYKTTSMNSMPAVMNSFFDHLGCGECKVKLFKIQKVQFSEKEKELTEKDYERLVHMAERKGDIWMNMLPQTIGSTGIQINESRFTTVGALEKRRAETYNKRRFRVALLPMEPVKALKRYCRKVGIKSGSISITRDGKLMDRNNISKRMKVLGGEIGVDTAKIFPHNFKYLFARVFYSIRKDVARLMDLLGRSNISATGIYTMSMEEQPRRQMSWVRMVLS